MLKCVAECCVVLQSVAVCGSVLLCVIILQSVAECGKVVQSIAECCKVLQSVAVCCSVLLCVIMVQCVAVPYIPCISCMLLVCCSVAMVAVCCSVLQCVAVCCSVLQCVAICCRYVCMKMYAHRFLPVLIGPSMFGFADVDADEAVCVFEFVLARDPVLLVRTNPFLLSVDDAENGF